MEEKQYRLKPFEYIFKDTVFSVEGDNIIADVKYGDVMQELIISDFENSDFEKIRIFAYSDLYLNDLERMGHKRNLGLEIKLDLIKKRGHLIFDTTIVENQQREKENAVIIDVKLLMSTLEFDKRPLKVDYKGYSMVRTLSKLLNQQEILSELLISRGLGAISQDDDYKLLEKYYIELARKQVIKQR